MANVSFFGLELTPGKEEPTPVPPGIILHISQATLAKDGKDGEVSRIFAVIEDEESDSEDEDKLPEKIKREFAIATLVGKSKESQSLELNFSEIDGDVSFKVVGGHSSVHLAGYYNQVGTEEDMFAGDEDMDGDDLPSNFQFYGGDSDDENADDEFKPNESELNASNDSGYVIHADSDDEEADEDEINAKLEELRTQIAAQEKSGSKKRKNAPTEEKKPAAKKAKTETKAAPAQTPKKAEQSPKKPAQKQTPAKNTNQQQQQSAKKSGKKNKKNKKN